MADDDEVLAIAWWYIYRLAGAGRKLLYCMLRARSVHCSIVLYIHL